MVAYFRDSGRRATALGGAAIAFVALVAAWFGVSLAGTKTGAVLALGAVFGPVLLSAAIVAPILFPFSLYAFLTPFDPLLAMTTQSGTGSTITLLVGAASGAALIFYILRTKRFADPPRAVAVWLLYFLWTVSSTFWAIDTKETLSMLPTMLALFGLYVVVSMLRIDAATLRTVGTAIVAGAATACAYMLFLYSRGMANTEDRLWLRNDSVQVNPDHFAAALLLPIAIALATLFFTRGGMSRLAMLVSLALMLPVMILTGARGPELAFVALAAYVIAHHRKRWTLAGVFVAFLALIVIKSGPSFAERWTQALSDGGAGRTDIWKVGWLAFKENWLFGAGYSNFPDAYNHALIRVFQPFFAGWSRAPHDILLQAGVELGIIGLVLLLLGWWSQFRVLRHIDASDYRYPMRIASEAAIVGLFVAGLFALQMETKYLWLAFMFAVLVRNTRLSLKGSPADA